MQHKPLHIPPNKKFKGLKILCYGCGTLVNGVCKKTGKSLATCQFADKHRYKVIVHVPGTKNERRVKVLETRNYDEAVKQAIDFQREVKEEAKGTEREKQGEPSQGIEQRVEQVREIKSVEPTKSYSLVGLMARYVGYLSGDPEIVPEFRRKERSKKHLEDIERTFKYFALALKKSGYDATTLNVDGIDEQMIGKFHDYLLKELKLSNRSYNRALTNFTSFYNYLIGEGYQIRNPFKVIPRRSVTSNPEIIEQDEYEKLLEVVQNPELGVATLGTGETKNLYKPWVKDAIELGMHTGRRNEEIARMKWEDVHEEKGNEPLYIKVPDFKVNRQKGITGEDQKYIYVPITAGLRDLLDRLGYDHYKGTEKYILAPEEELDRETVKLLMGRSFSHYYDQLGTGKHLTYRCLRKTYITHLTEYMGIEDARLITKHSGTEVMANHYIDKKYITKTAQGFDPLKASQASRGDEVAAIRKGRNDSSLER